MTEVYIVDLGDSYERLVIGVATTRKAAIKIAREHAARGNCRSEVDYYEMRRVQLDIVDDGIEITAKYIKVD